MNFARSICGVVTEHLQQAAKDKHEHCRDRKTADAHARPSVRGLMHDGGCVERKPCNIGQGECEKPLLKVDNKKIVSLSNQTIKYYILLKRTRCFIYISSEL